ncbi:MAG: hypothetical protein LBT20_05575 [Clostridiales bacterium]|jgi:hypothetical protein|nr:hypothetical protein [Clostridiales bacterium]
MKKTKKENGARTQKAVLRYAKYDINTLITLQPFIIVFGMLFCITVFFGVPILLMGLYGLIGWDLNFEQGFGAPTIIFIVFVLADPVLCGVFLFQPFFNWLSFRLSLLKKMRGFIIDALSKDIIFLDEFPRGGTVFDKEHALAASKALVKCGALAGYEPISDILLAKITLRLSDDDAREYLKIHNNGGKITDVTIKLPDVERDTHCDNCGNLFLDGDGYCAYCGTARKDLRRRL